MIPSPEELIKEALDSGSYGEKGRRHAVGTLAREREKMKRRTVAMQNMGLLAKGKKKGSGSGLALAGLAGGAALTGLYLLHKKKKENEAALQAQRAAAQRAAMAGQMKMAEHAGPTSLIKMAAENLGQLRDA